MNVELASQILNHIEKYPEIHTESIWGEQSEKGCVASIAGHAALFSGLAKVKNGSIVLAEVDQREPDWIKTFQEVMDIPFSVAFRMTILCSEDQAARALKYIANNKLPNWKKVYQINKIEDHLDN